MTSRRPLQLVAVLSGAGLVLAALLVREHAQAHAGIQGFCTISEYVNCDRVATSRFAVVLGVPVAAWGGLAYLVMLVLALAGLRRARPHDGWPAGLLVVLAGIATAISVCLALVSELVIGALCLLCAGSWVASAAILASSWRATRPAGGARAAIAADLAVLAARPGRTAAVAVAGLAVVALAAAAYPRYWERRAADEKRPAQARAPRPAPPGSGGRTVVVEFSDYECPFCALAHEELKTLLAERPDVTLVKKHFPLDPACNPAVKRAIHPGACTLALAAICAEEQGKLAPMDDALFRNQKAKRPLDELVGAVGLDRPRFQECLRAPSTARRLDADLTAAMAVGIRATPTYVVNGVALSSAKLTPEDLPPPPGAAPAQVTPPAR